LSNGEVVYKLDGEWSGVLKVSYEGKFEDIIKISQNGNTFVGIHINGHKYLSAGDEAIKGELEKNGFKSVFVNPGGRLSHSGIEGLIPATGKISENCNKIMAKVKVEGVEFKLTLNRK
jgi:hypothetical protein